MQNISLNFLYNSFQSSNFAFVYFSFLKIQFYPIKITLSTSVNFLKKKILENIFWSLIDFLN